MRLSRAALVFGLLALVPACQSRPTSRTEEVDPQTAVGSFRLRDRNGGEVTEETLRGKVWVASFVFTRCTGPCPQVTRTMARLQQGLLAEPDVRLVTFTVDPEHDREKELGLYAEAWRADPERWLFLTGPKDEVHRLLREGFHVPVAENTGTARSPGNEVSHSSRLVVVDRDGKVRGYFEGLPLRPEDPQAEQDFEANLERLQKKVIALAKEP